MVGGLGSGKLGTTILVLPHYLAFNRREPIIALITITLFSKVGAGINVLLLPLLFPALSPHSTATPTMCGHLAPDLDILVSTSSKVTTNLMNSTVV